MFVGKIKSFYYMSWTPTKEELEELGFKYWNVRCTLQIDKEPFDVELSYWWWFFIQIWDENRKLYPRSLSDLKTIISSFTPN